MKVNRADAYADAEKFDRELNHLLEQHPVEENPEYWLTLSRTIKSGLDIVETIAVETLRLQRRIGP